MRLLVFSHYFWPEDFRVNELVAELARRGHDVTVVTGKPNYPSGRIDPGFLANPDAYSAFEGARIIRVNVIRRGSTLRLILNYLSYAVSATWALFTRLRADRFDVVFVFQPSPFLVAVPALAYRALHKRPIVFWVLDQWPETLSAVGMVRSKWLLRLVGRFVAFTYARCELILVQSKGLIPVVRRYCGRTQPVEYFPNWAESQFHNAALRDAPEVPPAQGQFTVMFAGNLGTSQDLPAIIAAAARLDGAASIRWVIVGDGRAAKDAQAEVARRGLAGKISFLGRFPAERMPEFFRCADALLVSLRPDPVFAMTIPGKVQSYLMSGVPLIGMIDGEGARVIVEAEAGFAGPAGDPQALAENVRRLAEMSVEDRRKMGDRGRAYALREFDRQGLIDKLDTWLVEAARTAEPV